MIGKSTLKNAVVGADTRDSSRALRQEEKQLLKDQKKLLSQTAEFNAATKQDLKNPQVSSTAIDPKILLFAGIALVGLMLWRK